MPNNLEKFKQFTTLLDEVYKQASTTSDFDMPSHLVKAGQNANEIIVPKLTMDGLGDYDRNSGYTDGDVDLTHETVKYNYERGRMFTVDSIDNEETAGVAFGQLACEFIRTKVIPEIDAVRYASYAGITGATVINANLNGGEAVLNALLAAMTKLDEDEVIQGLPLNRNGWHAGDGINGKGNRKGIAIEICKSTRDVETFQNVKVMLQSSLLNY